MENENQTPHKRRVHYKGKYPKKFEEKYKELQPEKYKDTIAHVIQKGNTPAGMHISIMVKEILDFLQIKPGQTGFDATLGYGGQDVYKRQFLPFYTSCSGALFSGGTDSSAFHSIQLNLR